MVAALMVATAFSAIATALPLPVTSTASCPDAATVEGELGRLLPDGFPPGYALRVAPEGPDQDALRLELIDPSGRVASKRRLAPGPSCAAVAEELAVVAATWLGDLPPQAPLAMPPPPEVIATLSPPPVIAPAPPAIPWRWSVGLGTGLSTPGAIWVTQAFALETRWLFGEPHGFYLGVGGYGTWPRAKDYPDTTAGQNTESVSWYRIRVLAEAGAHWSWARFSVTAGGGAGGGMLVQRSTFHDDYHRGDVVLMAQSRGSYALESLNGVRLWMGVRGSRAMHWDENWNAALGETPNSVYEFGLLAGCDFFLVP